MKQRTRMFLYPDINSNRAKSKKKKAKNIANDLGASPATLDKRGSAGEQEWVIKSPARDVKNKYQNMQERREETYL